MGFIRGEGRDQGTLFPIHLDDLIPADHVARVIEAFVHGLDLVKLGFERAQARETGRPGYDPRDLLKLYIYGYLHQIRSTRRLESECRRNVELMWMLGRLYPDHKSIAEFRRIHREAITQASAELVRFARRQGLVRGEWVAIDGTKFRAVSSAAGVAERQALERYLDGLDVQDAEETFQIDPAFTAVALEKLRAHREPEVGFMPMAPGRVPAYNVQTVVDAENALIVAHDVVLDAGDNRCLQPMAEAAARALDKQDDERLKLAVDAGYANGEQASSCEAQGLIPHGPVKRAVNHHGQGTFFDRTLFTYDPAHDILRCPNGAFLRRLHDKPQGNAIVYGAHKADCKGCPLKSKCTHAQRRTVMRHVYEDALERMNRRATPQVMSLRRCTVEHPFGGLKWQIFNHPRFLLRGRKGALTEITLGVIAYNLKRMVKIMGAGLMEKALMPG